MSMAILGIDVSKRSFDVTLLLTQTENSKPRHKLFSQSKKGFRDLRDWLTHHGVSQAHACLEATGTYAEDLALFLTQEGHRVSLVNPARISAFAQSRLSRNKTDKADALLIAQFCQAQSPEPWSPLNPAIRELQSLIRHLDSLNDSVQKEENRLESGIRSQDVVSSIESVIGFLKKEIQRTKKKIEKLIDDNPDIRRDRDLLTSIPGIGELTASKLLAEVPDMKKYESVKQLVAYAGLNPRQWVSGTSIHRKSRLSKTGSSRVRKALFMPALVAKVRGEAFKSFEARLLKNGKSKMTIVGAIMRKLLHIAYGVLKNQKPFDPKLAFAA